MTDLFLDKALPPPFLAWWADNQSRILQDLAAYIAIDTCSPNEMAAKDFLTGYLEPLGFQMCFEDLPSTFENHREKCPTPVSHMGEGAQIMRAIRHQDQKGRHIIVNAHVDVVPLQKDFANGFNPQILKDRIIGRGSVDTKGNLIMFIEALRFMIEQGIPMLHSLTLDLVAEEEIGGNGALASVLSGSEADCALVLEPTNLEVFGGHRGCVSFEVVYRSPASHMGNATGECLSVIDLAALVVQALRGLEKELNFDKGSTGPFSEWVKAVQVNVGEIHGGDWLGSIPSECRIAGNCGFLPDHGLEGTKARLEKLFSQLGEKLPGAVVEVSWPALHNEAYFGAKDDPFVQALLKQIGQKDIRAWNVSCDARHYARILNIPSVIYGCGSLAQAHAQNETLFFEELRAGIQQTIAILSGDLGAASNA